MIKLGIFGDQTTHPEFLKQLNSLNDNAIIGGYFYDSCKFPEGIPEFQGPMELMDYSEALLILSDKRNSCELIKLILRKSKHLFLKTIPNLNLREIKDLAGLEKEAGIICSIYSPFKYIPFFDPIKNKYEKPLLINLRTSFEGGMIGNADELLLLLTALNHLVQSNSRKIEIFGLDQLKGQLVINLRIEFHNGSVVNLTLSQEESAGMFEVFHSNGRNQYHFEKPLYSSYSQVNQELRAVSDFVESIKKNDRTEISFDRLTNGVHMLNQIQQTLHFNGIDF